MKNQPSSEMRILEALEAGDLDVESAVQALQEGEPHAAVPHAPETPTAWYAILGSAIGITAMGGYLATLAGWWWLLAAPLLAIGGGLLLVAALSYQQPWLRVRITPAPGSRDPKIAFSLPFPPGVTGRIMRVVGAIIPSVGRLQLDAMLLAVEDEIAYGQPLVIDVVDEAEGQDVQIRWG
jgi:hypothetical protein